MVKKTTILLALLLCACTRTAPPPAAEAKAPPPPKQEWYKPGATAEDIIRTYAHCTMQAAASAEFASINYFIVRRYCMIANGLVLRDVR